MLGLSGGIDSTLVLLIAVDALGADRVTAVVMPSRYSSEGTQSDARELAANLGVQMPRPPDRAGDGGLREDARPVVRGPRARHHRGEPAGADPRQPADGAVEQVRLARAHDRQQVGELGRLLDAVRRLGRRVRGDQGRAEDARLPARRLPQRARRERIRSRARSSSARRAPSCGPTRRTPTRCPTTTRSTRSSRPTSRRTPGATSSRWPACPRRRSSASSRSSTAPSTSAARRRRGSRSRRARSAATGACRSRTPTAGAEAPPARVSSASIISACRKCPRLIRATPSSASRSTGGAPGRSRTLTGTPVSTNAAIIASSTTPIG